jgi:hypothetical protein
MSGRSQTLPLWLGGGGVKTTENKIHWPRWLHCHRCTVKPSPSPPPPHTHTILLTSAETHTGPFGVFQGLAYLPEGGEWVGYSHCGDRCRLAPPPPSWQGTRLSFSSPMPDGKKASSFTLKKQTKTNFHFFKLAHRKKTAYA